VCLYGHSLGASFFNIVLINFLLQDFMLFVVLHHIISECEIEFTDLFNADGSIWQEHLLLVVIRPTTSTTSRRREAARCPFWGSSTNCSH